MVSVPPVCGPGDRVVHTLLLVVVVVLAIAVWGLYRVYAKQEMILRLMNGDCL